jgi:hypothetical protein
MVVGAVGKVAVAGFDGLLIVLYHSGYRETCTCALQSVFFGQSFPSFEPLLLLHCTDIGCELSRDFSSLLHAFASQSSLCKLAAVIQMQSQSQKCSLVDHNVGEP